jgi:hypothetical protein
LKVLKKRTMPVRKMMFSSIAPVQEFVKDGRLVGLATTGPKRDPACCRSTSRCGAGAR